MKELKMHLSVQVEKKMFNNVAKKAAQETKEFSLTKTEIIILALEAYIKKGGK